MQGCLELCCPRQAFTQALLFKKSAFPVQALPPHELQPTLFHQIQACYILLLLAGWRVYVCAKRQQPQRTVREQAGA